MGSKPGYILVEAPHLDWLKGYVNDAIANGYRPIGAPFNANPRHREYGEHDRWVQAMTLRDL